ncbi:hypothetical protein THAOC_06030, partial [Thalassiosira oceanica]
MSEVRKVRESRQIEGGGESAGMLRSEEEETSGGMEGWSRVVDNKSSTAGEPTSG